MLKKIQSSLNNLTLAKKLTILLVVIFIGGISFSGMALASILNYKAQNEISSRAALMMHTLASVRSYTNTEVSPALRARLKSADEFLPQSIPSYSSNQVFANYKKMIVLTKSFPTNQRCLTPLTFRIKLIILKKIL